MSERILQSENARLRAALYLAANRLDAAADRIDAVGMVLSVRAWADEARTATAGDAARQIEVFRKHLKDAAGVFSTLDQRLRFLSLPGGKRREIADECRFRAEQFREAANAPFP